MADAIRHRGPDGEGVIAMMDGHLALSHRRLAIVDLSPHGAQPMTSADGRWTISYNGEIYNHRALREELPGHPWVGGSDTETLLELIARRGVEAALRRAVGMFALAVFDRHERRLYLARDRFGEKPLYYGWCGRDFVFASELKAIRRHPDFDGAIEPRALSAYFATTVIGAPWSIHRRLFKLEPATILEVALADGPPAPQDDPVRGSGGGFALTRYWDYGEVVRRGLERPIRDELEALDALGEVLGRAVADQLVADVPVGAFLSGGIDSSTIVALAQAGAARPVHTYSIGFDEPAFDESGHARAVAAALGTRHHEQIVRVEEARAAIPDLAAIYDEPFADSSQLPTLLVSRFARQHVTVALSGDGGDELFGGYNRHRLAPAAWNRARRVPAPVRRAVGGVASLMPDAGWRLAARAMGGHPDLAAKLRKGARVLGRARGFDDVYDSFFDEWGGAGPTSVSIASEDRRSAGLPPFESMLVRDALTYLPDDILAKVDRASMSVSLETRAPFLDHRVAELAARVPQSMKLRDGRGKLLVRTLLGRHLDPGLFERPKAGFAIPVGEWVRGPLRDWAEALVRSPRLAATGLIDQSVIDRRWAEHLRGGGVSTPAIWSVLMLSAWLEEWA